jgi:hypothetical protein
LPLELDKSKKNDKFARINLNHYGLDEYSILCGVLERQGRLEAGYAKILDCSLADLYDEVAMPSELRKVHQENDRVVMDEYGFEKGMSEVECVTELFNLYQEMTK